MYHRRCLRLSSSSLFFWSSSYECFLQWLAPVHLRFPPVQFFELLMALHGQHRTTFGHRIMELRKLPNRNGITKNNSRIKVRIKMNPKKPDLQPKKTNICNHQSSRVTVDSTVGMMFFPFHMCIQNTSSIHPLSFY